MNTQHPYGQPVNTRKWELLTLLTTILVFLALVLIHVAHYVLYRNLPFAQGNFPAAFGAGGVPVASSGWSAYVPIFQNGLSEFISLGFILLPLILLMLIFWGGFWELAASIVALVFAVINFVTILFTTIGIIIVMVVQEHTNASNLANGDNDFCNLADRQGSNFDRKVCQSQRILVAGIVFLLFTQLLTLWLAVKATRLAKDYFFASRVARNQAVGAVPVGVPVQQVV